MAVASAGPYASLHLAPDRLPCQHPTTQFFTGRMPFLPPNQQCKSTEGTVSVLSVQIMHKNMHERPDSVTECVQREIVAEVAVQL